MAIELSGPFRTGLLLMRLVNRTPVNGRDKVNWDEETGVSPQPVLKHGPNTACGGNARERAWLVSSAVLPYPVGEGSGRIRHGLAGSQRPLRNPFRVRVLDCLRPPRVAAAQPWATLRNRFAVGMQGVVGLTYAIASRLGYKASLG